MSEAMGEKEKKSFSHDINEFMSFDNARLFSTLRLVNDISERRELTSLIHEKKLSQWRKNKGFNESIARHLVEDVHLSFRQSFARVVKTSPFPIINVRSFNSINSSLHGHHNTEDSYWFPRLNQFHPEISGEQISVMYF